MDPNQYYLAYISGKTAHQAAAPAPVPMGPQNIVYLRRSNGSMLPIRDAEVGFFPASARIPHWATVHQAAERKAAEEAKKKAAEEKRKEAAKKKAAEEKKKEAAKKKKKEDEARRAALVIWAWDPITRQQRPVIPKGIDVPVPGHAYAYHDGNGNYRYYK